MSINSYFDKVFCINLSRRTDRWAQAQAEAAKHGIEIERHPGVEIDPVTYKPFTPEESAKQAATYGPKLIGLAKRPHGQMGTTVAHRMLLRKIADGPWKRALVLEDDFCVLTQADKPEWFNSSPVPHPCQERFDYLMKHVPDDWDVLYLGGGYGSPPIGRVSAHCVHVFRMMTTSSYGITKKHAQVWSDMIDEQESRVGGWNGVRFTTYIGPIDILLSEPAPKFKYYAVQPRLMVQRNDYSDATQLEASYAPSMTDGEHEKMV